MKKRGTFAGWYYVVTVISSFLIFSLTVGLGYNCWSAFTIPVCEDIAATRQQFSGLFTAFLVAQTIGALATDWMVKRLGMIRFMRLGSVLLTAAMLLFSRVQRPEELCIGGFLMGFPLAATCFLPFSVVMANWFVRLRGLTTGIVFMGSGLVSMIFMPLVQTWITAFGWRTAVLIMAAIVGAVAVPLCFFVLKVEPGEVGLTPYGAGEVKSTELEEDNWGYTLNELLRSPAFWLFVVYTLGIYLETMHSNTTIPYLSDIGYDAGFGANVWALCMGVLALGRISVGHVCDRLGVFRAARLFSLLAPLMLLGFFLVPKFPAAAVFIILGVGMGEAVSTVCYPMVVGRMFGRRHYTKIYGVLTAVCNVAGAFAPLMYGWIYTRTGSYLGSYRLCGCLYLAGLACLFAALHLCEKKQASD